MTIRLIFVVLKQSEMSVGGKMFPSYWRVATKGYEQLKQFKKLAAHVKRIVKFRARGLLLYAAVSGKTHLIGITTEVKLFRSKAKADVLHG